MLKVLYKNMAKIDQHKLMKLSYKFPKILAAYYEVVVLVLASGFLYLYRLGVKPLIYFDEGIYSQVALAIAKTNNYITLYQGDVLWFEKPPLYMYMSSTLYRLFGFNVSWSRLPSAIAGVILIVVVYFIARELFNRKTAILSGFGLLFTAPVLFRARQGSLDIMLTMFIFIGVLAYIKVSKNKNYWLLVWISFGLAFLTKGFASLILPMALVLAMITENKLKESIRTKEFWIGLVSSAVIILPWHIANILVNGSTFVQSYFGYHILKRSGEAIEGHQGGVLFYPKLFMKVYLPWIFVLPFSILLGIKRPQAIKWPRSSILLFIIVTTLIIFGFLIRTKIDWYIIPIYPALAIFVASTVNYYINNRLKWIIAIALFVIFVLALLLFPVTNNILSGYLLNTFGY